MNRVTLDNIRSKSDTGFTIADNEESITEFIDGTPEDDLDLLKFVVLHGGEGAQNLIQFCAENEKGIDINDTYYPFDRIVDILNGD